MAKSVKTLSNESNRDVDRREQSRKAQNERRKIERRMSRIIEEQTGIKIDRKEVIEQYVSGVGSGRELNALYKTYKTLVAKKGAKDITEVYKQDVDRVEESIEAFTAIRFSDSNVFKRREPNEILRRNKMFERNIAQSTKKEGLSTLDKNVTHGFYAATQYIWEDSSSSGARNTEIMAEFGINDMETIYKLVTSSELDFEEFGFETEADFDEWLDEIKERVDLDKLREIFSDEMGDIVANWEQGGNTNDARYNGNDEKEEKYESVKIGNIRRRTAKLKRHGR